MKIIRIVAMAFAVYVVLGMLIDAAIGYFQPQGGNTAVLRTFDANGKPAQTVLGLLDDNGQLWIESGHWFRGWYHRVLNNPDVELIRGTKVGSFHAVPVDTPEAVDNVTRLMGRGNGAGYWIGRTMLLYAPIRPVRLDPRPNAPEPITP